MIHFFKSLNSVWFEASTWLKLLFFKIRPKKFLQKRVWKIVQIFAFFVLRINFDVWFLGKNDKEAENVSFSALTHRVKFQLEICNFTNWLFEPCGKYHTGAWLNYLSFNGILLKVRFYARKYNYFVFSKAPFLARKLKLVNWQVFIKILIFGPKCIFASVCSKLVIFRVKIMNLYFISKKL